jgi:hypothetical protein
VVSFEYKGQPVEVLAQDREYADWLMGWQLRVAPRGTQPARSLSKRPGLVRRFSIQPQVNPGERGFYYLGDKSLYGSRCGHGEKAERDFDAHRIDEDSY